MGRTKVLEDRYETRISLERETFQGLKDDADELDVSVSYLVRRAIEQLSEGSHQAIKKLKVYEDEIAECKRVIAEKERIIKRQKRDRPPLPSSSASATSEESAMIAKYTEQFRVYCERVKPENVEKLNWVSNRAKYIGMKPHLLLRVLEDGVDE